MALVNRLSARKFYAFLKNSFINFNEETLNVIAKDIIQINIESVSNVYDFLKRCAISKKAIEIDETFAHEDCAWIIGVLKSRFSKVNIILYYIYA